MNEYPGLSQLHGNTPKGQIVDITDQFTTRVLILYVQQPVGRNNFGLQNCEERERGRRGG